jgi:hypothetical protein
MTLPLRETAMLGLMDGVLAMMPALFVVTGFAFVSRR